MYEDREEALRYQFADGDFDDIDSYEIRSIDQLREDDAISIEEAAFLEGYEDALDFN